MWAWFRVYSLGKLVHSGVSGASTKSVKIVRVGSCLGELTRKLDLGLCNESLGMELVGKLLGSLPAKPVCNLHVACLELGCEGLKMAEFGSGQVKAQEKGVQVIMRRTLVFIQSYMKLLE